MTNQLDALTANIKNYIVSPMNAFGLGGFVFDIEGETTAKLDADITDHYTEDNKAVQDHIARKPKIITLRGYVGEVVYKNDGQSTASSVVQTVTQKLTQLTAFLPTISTAAKQAQSVVSNETIGFNEGLTSTADIYGLVKNIIGSSGDMANQQQAYLYFKACWEQGILMSIQTPWEFLTNMAIQSVTAIQSETSTEFSDFAVTYKEMRFAKTIQTAYSAGNQGNNDVGGGTAAPIIPVESRNLDGSPVLQGDAAIQAMPDTSNGKVNGIVLPTKSLPGPQAQIENVNDYLANPAIKDIFIRGMAP